MKFERFISTFVMMNIVLLIAAAFAGKNDLMMSTLAKILYAKQVDSAYFELPPENLENFAKDSDKDIKNAMSDIFAKTSISKEKFTEISSLAPYEHSVAIVKMFSLMGDGECLTGDNIVDKITKSSEKNGCAKDFAQIFTLLATAAGLDVRIVSNGMHYGTEIFDGEKWIYIDPYFAMSASSETEVMSYKQFAEAMLNNGWMRFNQFGGENHCMNGKQVTDHPYFGDKSMFANISVINGSNILEMLSLENRYNSKHALIKYLAPHKNGHPKVFYSEPEDSEGSILRKYVTAYMVVVALIFLGTNIVLPVYFIVSLIGRSGKK